MDQIQFITLLTIPLSKETTHMSTENQNLLEFNIHAIVDQLNRHIKAHGFITVADILEGFSMPHGPEVCGMIVHELYCHDIRVFNAANYPEDLDAKDVVDVDLECRYSIPVILINK